MEPRPLLGEVVGTQLLVPKQPLGEARSLSKVGNAYLSERGVASKLFSEKVSVDSPLGEGLASALRRNAHCKGGGVPVYSVPLHNIEAASLRTKHQPA